MNKQRISGFVILSPKIRPPRRTVISCWVFITMLIISRGKFFREYIIMKKVTFPIMTLIINGTTSDLSIQSQRIYLACLLMMMDKKVTWTMLLANMNYIIETLGWYRKMTLVIQSDIAKHKTKENIHEYPRKLLSPSSGPYLVSVFKWSLLSSSLQRGSRSSEFFIS